MALPCGTEFVSTGNTTIIHDLGLQKGGTYTITITVGNYLNSGKLYHNFVFSHVVHLCNNFCERSCENGSCMDLYKYKAPHIIYNPTTYTVTDSFICTACNFGYVLSYDNMSCELNSFCSWAEWSQWSRCTNCESGYHSRSRNFLSTMNAYPYMCSDDLDVEPCSYPCNFTGNYDIEEIVAFLKTQVLRNTKYYQDNVFPSYIIDITITESVPVIVYVLPKSDHKTRKSSVNMSDCQGISGSYEHFKEVTNGIFNRPVENISIFYMLGTNLYNSNVVCVINVTATGGDGLLKPSIIGIVIGTFSVLLIVILIIYLITQTRKRENWTRLLPEELQIHFDSSRMKGDSSNDSGFFHKLIKAETKEFERLKVFMKCLQMTKIPIDNAYLVLNEKLASNFVHSRVLLHQRMKDLPGLFLKQEWRHKGGRSQIKARTQVYEHYRSLVEKYPWNDPENIETEVPIVPFLHGTSMENGWSIVERGFAMIATVERGFYGQGMYFTSCGLYASPHFLKYTRPAILIALICPGNIYPVVEDHHGSESLEGKPLCAGHQSNYVLTNKAGDVWQNDNHPFYDEIVIVQESQVVPIYLLEINGSSKELLLKYFAKDKGEPDICWNEDIEKL
eukprot:TRINITY_DN8678_c0_g1_i3.p1 TRINITY_DN8678_c0_g1~~TRINITY_DN8678_c0_g1_i3.p1  ORF type:complete len:618 (+),score=99.89 TRINITY_DN8678_c0_g1_i3:555-2408(+)